MSILEITGRLLIAAVCAAAIGFEREASQKSAGLRTHTLVGVGSAIFSVVSIIGFSTADQSRVAAQIVTGIGFLGAGAIFREGAFVKGLTTAAGLWTVAAIGMAAGSGSYALTVIATIVILIVLYGLKFADQAVARRTRRVKDRLEITIDRVDSLTSTLKFVRKIDPAAEQLTFKRLGDGRGILTLGVDPDHVEMISEMVAAHKGVGSVEILSPLYWKHDQK